MPPRVEGVVQHLHFQIFMYVLNLSFQHDAARAFRSQHDHPSSYKICSFLAQINAFVLATTTINLEKV